MAENNHDNNSVEAVPKRSTDLFNVKSANDWIILAKKRVTPKMLFSELWFEFELCILFSDTNLGKSILAVQIADSISRGQFIQGFLLQTMPQKVLYFDFEMSDKQFENRYSKDYNDHYEFDVNFLRVEFNPDMVLPEKVSYEEHLFRSLKKAIIDFGAKVLVIDNISYLKSQTEKSQEAIHLMKVLKDLKSKYNLSILVLAHTPKRDLSKPISKNDLAGSKNLINFCDSAFTLGESNVDSNLRYIKQIKQRNTEQLYGADNVCVCQIAKPHNFLQFELIRFGNEREHLKEPSVSSEAKLESEVKNLCQQGKSQRQVSAELGISLGKVNKLFNK